MNQSPETRLLTRYVMLIVLGVVAFAIGPRAFGRGVSPYVLLAAAVTVTRIVFATPQRFADRDATPRLRTVWYVFLAEVVVAAIAFVLAFDRHGSFAGSIAAVVVMILLEIVATRMQRAEHVRTGEIIQGVPGASPDDFTEFTGEAGGPANDALKDALMKFYANVPTVVRAYLMLSAAADGTDQRVLAVRFAYPWMDEDAVRAALRVFAQTAPAGESMTVIALDDRSEARARMVASPFYERPGQTPAQAEP